MDSILDSIPKSETVAIVVPLYGMFRDGVIPELTEEFEYDGKKSTVFQTSMSRLRSYKHKYYYVFVGEKGRVSDSVMHSIMGKNLAGNTRGVEVEQHATYAMYVDEGIRYALENLDSKFIVVAAPWLMLKEESIDSIMAVTNGIGSDVTSGFDLRRDNVSPADFENHVYNPPRRFWGINVNFFGANRSVLESIKIDTGYKTQTYFERDLWQIMQSKGLTSFMFQDIMVYSVDIDWSPLEGTPEREDDKARFLQKWGFAPAEL
ncbi:MAG: hypothetical protein ACYDBV_12150 [Nitrospiria bacterium]